jgi:hypothetical protein
MKKTSLAIAAILLAAPLTSAAYADRPPTPGERARLSDILRSHGFVSWRKIERDDGKWEIEDARTRSGKVYDLEIRKGRIVEWDRD